MSLKVPSTLKVEHEHLHDDLMAAMAKQGRTGDAARVLARHLQPHVQKEEEFAMPPLGLLAILAQAEGRNTVSPDDARTAIAMADRLSSEMPRMLAEHREIVAALRSLITEAQEESHGDVVAFAERLMQHAQTEEEVLYPATVLIGRYLKAKALVGSDTAAGHPG